MKKSHITTLIVIVLAGTLVQVGTDVYTPSLPAIARALRVSIGQVQATLTLFVFGVAITNLLYGPLSEVIGRRSTMIVGNVIALGGTLLCINAHTIHMLQWGRLLQGVGLGACAALWRSIFRDTYHGADMAKVASYLTNAIILSVIVAPILGGYLQEYFGWRASFVFLCVWIIVVTLVTVFCFHETSAHHGRHRLSLSFMKKAYAELLTSRLFIGMSLSVLLSYGGLFAWIMASPVILIHGAGVSPANYGLLLIATGLAIGLGGIVNGRLVHRVGMVNLLYVGWSLMFLSGFLMAALYYLYGLNVLIIMIPAVIFSFGTSMIYANAVAIAFAPFGHIAGFTGALYNCSQLMGGVVFGSVLASLNTSSQLPLALVLMISPFLAWIVFKLLVSKPLRA